MVLDVSTHEITTCLTKKQKLIPNSTFLKAFLLWHLCWLALVIWGRAKREIFFFFFLYILPRSICFRHSWKETVGQDEPLVLPSMGVLHPLRAEVHVTFKGLAAKQFVPKSVEIHIWIRIWHGLWKSRDWKTWSRIDNYICRLTCVRSI